MNAKDAQAHLLQAVERMHTHMKYKLLDKSLPDDWAGLDYYYPVKRKTTRVTLRLDADMVSWFRKLGPGYQERINLVLRMYYTALMSGHIKAHQRDNPLPRLAMEAERIVREGLDEDWWEGPEFPED